MKKLLLIVSLILFIASAAFADDLDVLAFDAAQAFAAMVDEGNLQAAYWSGSQLLQLANDEQAWIDEAARAQLVLGKARQRVLKKIRPVNSPAHFPDDDYRIVYFETETAQKAKAAEVLYVHEVGGLWKVCYYSIR
jgi:hypothetical protein